MNLSKSATILLVEDDTADQELMRRAIRANQIDVELKIVDDGDQALDYLNQRGDFSDPERCPRPDLVLLDLNMPRVSGFDVLRAVRDDEALCSVPIVVLTTSESETDVAKAYRQGAKSYIVKPNSPERFVRTVKLLEQYWLGLVVLPKS